MLRDGSEREPNRGEGRRYRPGTQRRDEIFSVAIVTQLDDLADEMLSGEAKRAFGFDGHQRHAPSVGAVRRGDAAAGQHGQLLELEDGR